MRYYAYCQPLFHKKSVFFLRILLKIDVSDRTDSFCRYPANCNINFWCRCSASAAIQRRKLVVRSTKSPAGAVQTAQWRELDLSSSRAPAESPVVIRCPVGSRNFVPRPLAVEPPTGGKEHEGFAPSYSAAGENHLHLGKPSLPSFKILVQVLCICRSPAVQAGRAQHEIPRRSGPIRSMART